MYASSHSAMFLAIEFYMIPTKITIHDAQMPLRWIVVMVNADSCCLSIFGIVVLTLWRVYVPKWTSKHRVQMLLSWKGPNRCFRILYVTNTLPASLSFLLLGAPDAARYLLQYDPKPFLQGSASSSWSFCISACGILVWHQRLRRGFNARSHILASRE